MASISPQLRAKYGRNADAVPADVLAAIGQDELLDRLDEAAALTVKAMSTQSPVLTRGYLDQVRRVLRAQPRDVTEAQAGQWLAKADAAHTSQFADTCRERAALIRSQNPVAPRRARTAAATSARGPVLVWAREQPGGDAPVTTSDLSRMVKAAVADARAAGLLA